MRAVPEHEPVVRQLTLDRFHRRDESLVGRRAESDERHQQHARVELVGLVGLRECLLVIVPRLLVNFCVDLVAERLPPLERALASELGVVAAGTVERDDISRPRAA